MHLIPRRIEAVTLKRLRQVYAELLEDMEYDARKNGPSTAYIDGYKDGLLRGISIAIEEAEQK